MIQLDSDSLDYASVLDDRYLIVETIGQGRYAKVKLAIDIVDKKRYAIKIMKVEQIQTQQTVLNFVNEVSIQSDLQHKNIVKIIKCCLDGIYRKFDGRIVQVSYFVMKLADYGELYEIMENQTIFTERLARNVYQQLIEGIEYMHERGVVHRDIKSENLLFSKSGYLKLADFGFSTKVFDDKGSRIIFSSDAYIGSPEYNPPELTNTANNKNKNYFPEAADLFASGVILFTLVMKSAPFKSTKISDEYYKTLKTNKNSFWKIFSDLCQPSLQFRDFIEKILDENANKRLTIEQIKKHAWYLGPVSQAQEYTKEVKSKLEAVFNSKKQSIIQRRNLKFQNRRQQAQNKNLNQNNSSIKPHNQDNVAELQVINARLEVNRKKVQKYTESSKTKNDQIQIQSVIKVKVLAMEEKKENKPQIKQKRTKIDQNNSSSSGNQASPEDSDQ